MKQKNAPKGAFFYSAMIDTVLPHQVHWIVPTFPVLRRSGESVEGLRCALKRSSCAQLAPLRPERNRS